MRSFWEDSAGRAGARWGMFSLGGTKNPGASEQTIGVRRPSSGQWASASMGINDDETLSRKEGTGRARRDGGGLHGRYFANAREGHGIVSPGVSAVPGLGNFGIVEERSAARG